jgi:hypothetical protein
MISLPALLVLAALSAPSGPGGGASPAVAPVVAGEKGWGLTVFRGTVPERFEVEMLGTLEGMTPSGALHLARVSGAGLEKSGIVAGMSGSPIWVGERLVGALAFSWQFASEPVAGITPIESMRTIPTSGSTSSPSPSPARVDAGSFLAAMLRGDPESAFPAVLSAASQGRPSGASSGSLPLGVSGLPASTLDRFAPFLTSGGLLPVAGGGGASGPASGSDRPLVPGGSVAAVLVDGDLSVSALGTVTAVTGNEVLAFGHPFLGLGPVDFPLVEAEVVAVLPNLARSFKFGKGGREIGRVYQDRPTGVGARLGEKARTVPLELLLRVEGKSDRTLRFRLARHPLLTPVLAALAADSVLSNLERGGGDSTLDVRLEAETPSGKAIWGDRFAGLPARAKGIASLALMIAWLEGQEAGGTEPDSIRIELRQADANRGVRIVRVDAGGRKVRAGEALDLRVLLRPLRKPPVQERLRLEIPRSILPGTYSLLVADGRTVAAAELAGFPLLPSTGRDAIALLGKLRPGSRLEAVLFRKGAGAVVSGRLFPELPPSMLSLFPDRSDSPTEGGYSFVPVAFAGKEIEGELDGAVRLELEIAPPLD